MRNFVLLCICCLLNIESDGQTNLARESINAIGDFSCCEFTLPQAFDGDPSTGPLIPKLPASIGYKFESGTVVNCYRWHAKSGAASVEQPCSWQFQGSADGTSWTTLHTIMESPEINGWTKLFNFPNDNAYKYYKILILGTRSNKVSIGELELFDVSSTQLTADLEVTLTSDVNNNGITNPGDKLTYTTTIRNSGSSAASALSLQISAPLHTKAVPGSLKTSALAADDYFSTSTEDSLMIGTSVLENDFGLPSLSVLSFGTLTRPSENLANGVNTGLSEQGGVINFNTDGTFVYKAPPGFTGHDRFAYICSSGTLPDDYGVVTISVELPVEAVDDYYDITGNVHNIQEVSKGLLSNDTGGSLVVTEVDGNSQNIGKVARTEKGGKVIVQSNGSFIYYPPVGYQGEDGFIYTANNSLNKPSMGEVKFLVSGMLWFIDGEAIEVGDGTLAAPFNSLSTFNHFNNGIGNNPGPGNTILISAKATEYQGGIKLLDNQKLIGQRISENFHELTGITLAPGSATLPPTTGNYPAISNHLGVALTLAKDNLINGLKIGSSSEVAIRGRSFGIFSFKDVLINTPGQALDLVDGTMSGNFTSVISSGGLNNISLINIETIGLCALGSSSDELSNATSDAVKIEGSTGSFIYSGNVTNKSTIAINIVAKTGGSFASTGLINPMTPGKGISIANCSNGTAVIFAGSVKRIDATAGAGVNLSNNPGCYINFKGGGLDITASNADGFTASNGGIVEVVGSKNTISSTAGVALKIENTTIGEQGITFQTISANGGRNGIILDNTGTLAGLTITGKEMKCGSGGIIQKSIGLDGQPFGNGIYLNQTNKINLNFVHINDHVNNGIYGRSLKDLVLNKVRVTGINGTSNLAEFEESAIHLIDLAGSVVMKNSFISGGSYNNILVKNSLNEIVLNALVFDTDTIDATTDVGVDERNVALQVTIGQGIANTKIVNSIVQGWRGDGIRVTYNDAGAGSADISNNYINNSFNARSSSSGIIVLGGELSYVISHNNIQNVKLKAISAENETFGKYMRGLISHNTIGTPGVSNSGAALGYGVFVRHCGPGTTSAKITNNIIRQVGGNESIRVLAGEDIKGGGSGEVNLVVNNNNIAEPGVKPGYSIFILCGMAATDKVRMCVDLKENIVKDHPLGMSVKQMKLTTVNLAGYTGNPNNISEMQRFLMLNNNYSQVTVGSTGIYNGMQETTCPQ